MTQTLIELNNRISKATIDDIDGILEIANYHDFRNKTPEQRKQEGFLVYIPTKQDLHNYISDEKNMVYVAKNDNKVIAYLIGLKKDGNIMRRLANTKTYSSQGENILNSEYHYFKHVAKSVECPTSAVLELMECGYEELRKRGYRHAMAEISLENAKSLVVHQSRGYECIGELYDDQNDLVWGIFAKNLCADINKNEVTI